MYGIFTFTLKICIIYIYIYIYINQMKVHTPYMDAMGIRKIIKYEFPFEKAFFARAMFFFQGGQFGSSSWYGSVSKPYDASWVSCTPKIEIHVKMELRGSPNIVIPVSRWSLNNPVKRYVTCLHWIYWIMCPRKGGNSKWLKWTPKIIWACTPPGKLAYPFRRWWFSCFPQLGYGLLNYSACWAPFCIWWFGIQGPVKENASFLAFRARIVVFGCLMIFTGCFQQMSHGK